MSTSNPQVFETILSINPYENSYFTGSGNQLAVERNPVFQKKQGVISYLNTNDFITALVSVSKNIPDEDLAFVIETKAYEELALDMAVEYQIKFVEAEGAGSEKERSFHVFVVDPLVLEENFVNSVKYVQYIDHIVPVPLLLKALYLNKVIEESGVHVFIYFQENDAFFTLYRDHEFIYTKSLKYSIHEMHERFNELLGEQVQFSEFAHLLADEGLSTANAEYQKYLIKLFGELFLHINDVVTYAKRAYEIEKIDSIYIGSEIGNIIGLDEYCQTYLGFEAEAFDFNYGFLTEHYVDQIHQLMQLYARLGLEEKQEANFSIFHRPPPFFQRESGKLFVVMAGSLLLTFAYPAYFWTMGYAESVHKSVLETKYAETHPIRITREATINLKLQEKEKAQGKLATAEELFAERKDTLEKIHNIKVNYPMKGKIVAGLTEDLNRFKVGVSEILYSEDNTSKAFTFSLMAEKDKQITDLIEFLTKNRAKEYQYSTERIYLDNNSSYYRSDLKVVLK